MSTTTTDGITWISSGAARAHQRELDRQAAEGDEPPAPEPPTPPASAEAPAPNADEPPTPAPTTAAEGDEPPAPEPDPVIAAELLDRAWFTEGEIAGRRDADTLDDLVAGYGLKPDGRLSDATIVERLNNVLEQHGD